MNKPVNAQVPKEPLLSEDLYEATGVVWPITDDTPKQNPLMGLDFLCYFLSSKERK
jgi:hypothetical protein